MARCAAALWLLLLVALVAPGLARLGPTREVRCCSFFSLSLPKRTLTLVPQLANDMSSSPGPAAAEARFVRGLLVTMKLSQLTDAACQGVYGTSMEAYAAAPSPAEAFVSTETIIIAPVPGH